MRKCQIISLLLLCLFHKVLVGQETNYSMFNNTPLLVNPASVASDDYAKLIFNYRTQDVGDNTSLRNTSVSLLMPIINNKLFKRVGGVSLGFTDSQPNDGSFFRFQQIDLSLAYDFDLRNRYRLSAGVLNSVHINSISTEGIQTGAQWMPNFGFNPELGIGETFPGERISFYSLGVSTLFYKTDIDDRQLYYAGITVKNLNSPNNSILDGDNELATTFSVVGGVRVIDKYKYSVTPEFLYRRLDNLDFYNVGARLSLNFANDNPFNPITSGSFDVSARYVNDRSLALGVQLDQKDFEVGFGFDVPVQSQTVSPLRSAFEVHFILKRLMRKKKPLKVVTQNTGYALGETRTFGEEQSPSNQSVPAQQNTVVRIGDEDAIDTTRLSDFRFELRKDFKFEFNKTDLNEEAQAYLKDLAVFLLNNQRLQLHVVGHADNVGTERANLKISGDRARAVRDFLVEQGVPGRRISFEGKGSSEPLAENDTEENRSLNRRVEFIMYE